VVRTLFSSPWIMARIHNRENLMNYNELIQLYFERSNAMQQYWNLYVIIVGGVLATVSKQVRDLIEPTLTPATFGSVKATHIISDLLTIAALCAMELRRRRLKATPSAP